MILVNSATGYTNRSFETSANQYDYAMPLNHNTASVELTRASNDCQDPVYADPELEESCLNDIYEVYTLFHVCTIYMHTCACHFKFYMNIHCHFFVT